MTGPESSLERRCVKLAKDVGGEFLKLLPWSVRGLPDRLLLLPGGLVVFTELKSATGSLTKLQTFWKLRLESLGLDYEVIRSVEEFEALLTRLGFYEDQDPRSMGWVDDRGRP